MAGSKRRPIARKRWRLTLSLAEGHTCLGNLYNDTGQYDKAVKEFQRADSLDPDSVDALNGLAEAYDRLGNAAAAEDTYRKAITLRPQYWAVYNWLGYFYFGQARYADAAAMFRKVVELTPDNNRGLLQSWGDVFNGRPICRCHRRAEPLDRTTTDS